jgi:hypothetical protein
MNDSEVFIATDHCKLREEEKARTVQTALYTEMNSVEL